jgi:cell division initiation protein
MRITPLEIKRKTFEKKLRGFDKDEVNAFLASLSQEWERLLNENNELKIKQETADIEVKKLREVENSLFKTLKTAEDTGANLIEQANKAAELHLREAQMNSEAVMRETKSKATRIIEEAENQAKNLIVEMQDTIKDLAKNYQSIESHRDSLIGELQNIILDITDRINRASNQKGTFKVEDHLIKVRKLVHESQSLISDEEPIAPPAPLAPIPQISKDDVAATEKLTEFIKSKDTSSKKGESKGKNKEADGSVKDESGDVSFFDQI